MSEYQLYLKLGGIRYKVKKQKVYKLTIKLYKDSTLDNTITKTYASGATISPSTIATEYLPTDYEVDSTTPTDDFTITSDTTLEIYYKAQSTGGYVLTFDSSFTITRLRNGGAEEITSPATIEERDLVYVVCSYDTIYANGTKVSRAFALPKQNVVLTHSDTASARAVCLGSFYTTTLSGYTFVWNDTPVCGLVAIWSAAAQYMRETERLYFESNNTKCAALKIAASYDAELNFPINTISTDLTASGSGFTDIYNKPTWVNNAYKTFKFIYKESWEEYGNANPTYIAFFMLPMWGTLTKN